MILEKNKAIERSVDSVARIYAVIIGLALSEAIKTLVVKDARGNLDLHLATLWSGAPAFVAFVFTLVPFWHGMNRHLDRCYLEKSGAAVQVALLFDSAVFFVEASIFFVAAWALRDGLITFYCIGSVLLIDVAWSNVSHQIHSPRQKSHAKSWSVINIICILLMVGVITFAFSPKPPVLMAIAIVRTIADYWNGHEFYFPSFTTQQPQT